MKIKVVSKRKDKKSKATAKKLQKLVNWLFKDYFPKIDNILAKAWVEWKD